MPSVLTDHVVRTLRAPPGPGWAEHFDAGCRGLRLRVSPKGEKIWSLMIRKGKRRGRHTIGGYPAVSLATARERARLYVSAARDGINPGALDRRKEVEGMTLGEAHAEYIKQSESRLRKITIDLKVGLFHKHVKPHLADIRLVHVRRADLSALADRLIQSGLTVNTNRVMSEIMALLRWCADRDWIDAVPVLGRSTRVKEIPRDRTLTNEEIVKLWSASEHVTDTVRDFLRILLLTGQRTSDVRNMMWAELDFEAMLWTIPASRYKTNRTQVVPLTAPVLGILRRLQAGTSGPFVLKGRTLKGRASCTAWNGKRNGADQLRKVMPEAATFVLHDIRRTVRTGLVRLSGVTIDVAEAVIGHAPSAIINVYDRHDRLPEKRHALDSWAGHVLKLLDGSGDPDDSARSNVVSINQGRWQRGSLK